jgi:hypothetical protein
LYCRLIYSMNQTLLYRFRLLQHFFLARSKFDIHSPFVYKVYSEILKDKADYPEYHTPVEKSSRRNKLLSEKDNRLLYRLSRYFKPKSVLILGTADENSVSSLISGSPAGCLISVHNSIDLIADPGIFDMVVVTDDLEGGGLIPDYFSRIMQHIHNDSVLIFCNIHGSKQLYLAWGKIKNHSFVTLTIDLFNLGLVFCKEELTKEDFILHY